MKPLVYSDNRCFRRPFDSQVQALVRLETEVKPVLQRLIQEQRNQIGP